LKTLSTIDDLYLQMEEYDLICSLGANCSVANELKRRGLRQIALPFDWTWFNQAESIKSLTEGFNCDFSNFMIKENLRKLENEEYSNWHSDRWQYEDTNTKVRYYNHFYKTENEEAEQQRVIEVFRKRCKKLDYLLQNSKKILLILSVINDIETKYVKELLQTIQNKYPSCEINIHFQAFNCTENECYQDGNLKVAKYKREENVYDYLQTNWEWRFLDKIKLSSLFYKNQTLFSKNNAQATTSQKTKKGHCKIINFWKLKKGFGMSILPDINTLIYTKLYLFGLRLHFCIGKNRIE